jgi:hypothetical protein
LLFTLWPSCLLITFFFLVTTPSLGASSPSFDHWWLKLLRYEKNLIGDKYQSQVTGGDFFFASDGQSDPQAELTATIEHFRNDVSDYSTADLHPLCRFPARRSYLEEVHQLAFNLPRGSCAKFTQFKQKINLDRAYVVFSSYFIDNPSSAFGHTLLRLKNRKSRGERNDLLDYGVNYSAQVDTKNPILYGIKGITGGFNGRFSMLPYFFKVREYNDMESRDLWSYELNLSSHDRKILVEQMWEMEHASFTYYYFSQHCSYHLIKLIDAINPLWDLSKHLKSFMIPIETVNILYRQSGLVRKITFRPSKYSTLNQLIIKMGDQSKKEFFTHLDRPTTPKLSKLSRKQQTLVLDALNNYLDYTYPTQILLNKGERHQEIREQKFKLLNARSQIPLQSPTLQFDPLKMNPPHLGHKTTQLSIGYLAQRIKNRLTFHFRPTLHEITDFSQGYNPHSAITMGEIEASTTTDQLNFSLDRLSIAKVLALRPIGRLEQKVSWNFDFGAKELPHQNREGIAPYLDLGIGGAYLSRSFTLAIFAQSRQHYTFKGDERYLLELGPKLICLTRFNAHFNLRLDYHQLYGIAGTNTNYQRLKGELNYHFDQNRGVSLWGAQIESNNSAGISWRHKI